MLILDVFIIIIVDKGISNPIFIEIWVKNQETREKAHFNFHDIYFYDCHIRLYSKDF